MLRWPSAIIGAICAVAAYGQQGVNQEQPTQNQSASSAVNITPLRVEMDDDELSEQMQVRNDSDAPLNVQLSIFRWYQADGTDQYAPSNEIIVSPSITRIAARQTQNFRLVRPTDKKFVGETRYRIIIDQLPDMSATSTNQSKTRLRFSVPLFVGRDVATAPQLAWKISGRRLNIVNAGGQTVKIGNAFLVKPDGERTEIRGGGTRYVLGNSDVAWELGTDIGCNNGPYKISAVVDQKIIDAIPSTSCP